MVDRDVDGVRRLGQYLGVKAWGDDGRAGFVGKPADFCGARIRQEAERFCRSFGIRALCVLRQQHGDALCVVQDPAGVVAQHTERVVELGCADALIVRSPAGGGRCGMAFGVRTADCVPVLLRAGQCWGAVHAGWRGLGKELFNSACRELARVSGSARIEAAIGPAAGPEAYEVGAEVISALGENAVSVQIGEQKYLLKLEESAARQLALCGAAIVYRAGVCTISDPNFHSYRRDGNGCGQNLAYFVV